MRTKHERMLRCMLPAIAAVAIAGVAAGRGVAVAQSASNAVALGAGEARALCTSDPLGASSLDDTIRRAQAGATQLAAKPESWVRVGWEWVRKARTTGDPGFYVNVASCADEALRVSPDDPKALELRGLVLMNGHRFEEARASAEQLLAVEPANAVALGTLSDALLELGRFDDAAATAQRAADVHPDSAVYARAAYLRWLVGDVAAAQRLIVSALGGRDRRDPEPAAWTFVEAAKISWHQGDYTGADVLVAEALRWVPDYPAALVMRGRIALGTGDPAGAIAALEHAFAAQPLPETAWLLADARLAVGDVAGANDASRRVVENGSRGDRLTLALFWATKDRAPDEALRLIEEERATRGGVYIDDAYAWALFRAGRIAEARTASDHAIRLGTRDARLLYHAGAIRLAAGDRSGRALVAQALALNPHFDLTGAAEARALLAKRDDC